MKFTTTPFFAIILGIFAASANLNAVLIGGVDFPNGAESFADSVVSYDPAFGGGAVPTNVNFLDPISALGVPDYSGGGSGTGSVSLGAGGRIILRFIDNLLTGSDDSGADLHIFEVGSDVEDTFVDISKDGILWTSVGKVFGSTSSIDIDAFGFTSADQISFVRLTDDISEGQTSGGTVGADIDAVGAISTVRVVPDSGSSAYLLMSSFIGLLSILRFSKRR